MATKKLINNRYLRARPPAPSGQRVEVFDTRIPGFGVRISDTEDDDPARRGEAGKITFLLYARFSPGAAPTRRTIGVFGAVTLEKARFIAGEWRSQIEKGIDPAVVEAEARNKEAHERSLRIKHSFANVAEAFIADKLPKERRGKRAEHELRTIFISAWADRPISEISTLDVLAIINTKKRIAPHRAAALLALIKRFFNWVADAPARGELDEQGQRIEYGLTASPCDRLTKKKVIGETTPRQRRLTDVELFAFWRATARLGYPLGSLYRVLALTGLRLNEAAQLSWPESPRRSHHRPGRTHEGPERKGARTSGAAEYNGDRNHCFIAAFQERPISFFV